MLGIEWLTTNGAIWDFDKSQICIGSKSYRLFARTGDGHWCRRVSVKEDTIVPPRSEIDLMTRVICRPSKESAADVHWGTELTTVAPGVHVSRTLIPTDRLCDVPVRIVNVLSELVLLTAGTTVAELQPVTVIGSIAADSTSTKREIGTASGANQVPEFIEQLLDGVHPSVPESTSLVHESLLLSYQDIFSRSEVDLGCTDIVRHCIDTDTARPFRQQLRRFPPAHVEAISQHVSM